MRVSRHNDEQRLPLWWPLAIPVCAAILVYLRALSCGFIGFDDDLYVFENPMVAGGLSLESLRWALTACHASTWQPLVWLSFMFDASLGGINATLFHASNVLLHALSVGLACLALRRLTQRPWLAAAVALLLALHPVHVESVVWIAERKDVLSACFWWGSVLAYAGYVARGRCWRWGVVTLLLALGLMAKPSLMTLPFALLLLDLWPLQRLSLRSREGWGRATLEKLPWVALAIGSLLVTYQVQQLGGSVLDTETVSLWGRFGNAATALMRYLGKLIWPNPLCVLYPHPGVWPLPLVGLSAAALATISASVWRWRERAPWCLVGWLWFVGTLVPTLGLVQIGWHSMADRFLYIPAVGIYVALVWSAAAVVARKPAIKWRVWGIYGVVVLLLAGVSVHQIGYWRSSRTLFGHAVAHTRDNWMMHNCLGAALTRDGEDAAALPHFRRAIDLMPSRPRAYYNLGCALVRTGQPQDAITQFQQSLSLYESPKALYNLAVAHALSGDPAAAESAYRDLLAVNPGHMAGLNNLGCLYREQGRLTDAEAVFAALVVIAPTYLTGRYNYGVTLLAVGKRPLAATQFRAVLSGQPGHAGSLQGLRAAEMPR
jgi:Tfp pilus assembly protein PilF